MSRTAPARKLRHMPRFMLHHRHEARECPAVFAAWKGVDSPLRHHVTVGSCVSGGHEIWWDVEAPDAAGALGQLPRFVAARATATAIGEIAIP